MRNIPIFKVFMSEDVLEPLQQVILSGYIGQGEQVEKFEKTLATHFGHTRINTINSGTSALHLALRLLLDENQERNEVLTVPLTCTATNFPILANGLKIRWVDTNPQTCNIDTDDLTRKLSPKTKAIMVVHWGGYPCDLNALKTAQTKCQQLYNYTPPIIEDCAHAWNAKYQGQLLGNHGNLCTFSFQAIKHLTSVDGGLLITPNETLHQRAKLLRWYGLDRTSQTDYRCQQNIPEWGYKFHMNDVNAVIGQNNYPHSLTNVEKHRENGQYFNTTLQNIPGITLLEQKDDRTSSYWLYTLRVENRNDFTNKMKEHGITISRVHDRNDKHPCVKEYTCSLPGTDTICQDMICIPCGWWVTNEDREYITECIKGGW